MAPHRSVSPTTAIACAIAALMIMAGAVQGCPDWAKGLSRHNEKRALHLSPALKYDNELAAGAQEWAETLAKIDCALVHAGGGSAFGENLYMRYCPLGLGIINSCKAATDAWYSEVSDYIFSPTPYTDNSATGKVTGHFSQVVWARSTKLGCGSAFNAKKTCSVVVCRYAAAGNYIGDNEHLSNVKEPKKTDGKPPIREDCADNATFCAAWAARGYCAPRYEWNGASVLEDVCPISCGSCIKGTTCEDRVLWCDDWKTKGYCDGDYNYLGDSLKDVLCRKTCGTCTARRMLQDGGDGETTEAPVPVDEQLAEDPDGSEGGTKLKRLPTTTLLGFPPILVKGLNDEPPAEEGNNSSRRRMTRRMARGVAYKVY